MSHGADFCIACSKDIFLLPEIGGCDCAPNEDKVNAIEQELLRRYTDEALRLALRLLDKHSVPSSKKRLIEKIEKEAAVRVAEEIFALWENIPEDLQAELRDFKILAHEIKKIKGGGYGSN